MDSLGLITAFRDDVDDNATPRFWSDATIAQYADDAQKMFCRLTEGLSDSTSDLTQIDVEAGEVWADLDPRILKIRRIQLASTSRPITIVSVEDMDQLGVRLDNRVGPLNTAIVGMEENKIRWGAAPAVNDTAMLTVYRLPLRTITAARTALEIAEQHHIHLLLWMKHKAYGKQDSDTYDPRAAERYEAAFRAYCAQVKIEQGRAKSKVRIVAYGGIGGGSGYTNNRGRY